MKITIEQLNKLITKKIFPKKRKMVDLFGIDIKNYCGADYWDIFKAMRDNYCINIAFKAGIYQVSMVKNTDNYIVDPVKIRNNNVALAMALCAINVIGTRKYEIKS